MKETLKKMLVAAAVSATVGVIITYAWQYFFPNHSSLPVGPLAGTLTFLGFAILNA